jgi:hypothetical protein
MQAGVNTPRISWPNSKIQESSTERAEEAGREGIREEELGDRLSDIFTPSACSEFEFAAILTAVGALAG